MNSDTIKAEMATLRDTVEVACRLVSDLKDISRHSDDVVDLRPLTSHLQAALVEVASLKRQLGSYAAPSAGAETPIKKKNIQPRNLRNNGRLSIQQQCLIKSTEGLRRHQQAQAQREQGKCTPKLLQQRKTSNNQSRIAQQSGSITADPITPGVKRHVEQEPPVTSKEPKHRLLKANRPMLIQGENFIGLIKHRDELINILETAQADGANKYGYVKISIDPQVYKLRPCTGTKNGKLEKYNCIQRKNGTIGIRMSVLHNAPSAQQVHVQHTGKNIEELDREQLDRLRLSNLGGASYRTDIDAATKDQRVACGLPLNSPIWPLSNKLQQTVARVAGIHSPYGYISDHVPGATFALHIEDYRLISLNYLYEGEKEWIIVPPGSRRKLEDKLHQTDTSIIWDCVQCIRHAGVFVPTTLLEDWDIPYSIVRQTPGDIIATMPDAYHEGWCIGKTTAEAVNYAHGSWSPANYKACQKGCPVKTFINHDQMELQGDRISRNVDVLRKTYPNDYTLHTALEELTPGGHLSRTNLVNILRKESRDSHYVFMDTSITPFTTEAIVGWPGASILVPTGELTWALIVVDCLKKTFFSTNNRQTQEIVDILGSSYTMIDIEQPSMNLCSGLQCCSIMMFTPRNSYRSEMEVRQRCLDTLIEIITPALELSQRTGHRVIWPIFMNPFEALDGTIVQQECNNNGYSCLSIRTDRKYGNFINSSEWPEIAPERRARIIQLIQQCSVTTHRAYLPESQRNAAQVLNAIALTLEQQGSCVTKLRLYFIELFRIFQQRLDAMTNDDQKIRNNKRRKSAKGETWERQGQPHRLTRVYNELFEQQKAISKAQLKEYISHGKTLDQLGKTLGLDFINEIPVIAIQYEDLNAKFQYATSCFPNLRRRLEPDE